MGEAIENRVKRKHGGKKLRIQDSEESSLMTGGGEVNGGGRDVGPSSLVFGLIGSCSEQLTMAGNNVEYYS